MKYLTVKNIQNMFLGAYQNVKKHKDEINKINMFPVPDQDTGSNLEQTIKGIYEAINKHEFTNIKHLSKAILDGALNFASGNVGIIYTGFLSGFFTVVSKENWNSYDLLKAFQNGAKQARRSIQDPKEGTILDVIDGAYEIKKVINEENDINLLLSLIIKHAKNALSETQNKMEIYRQASVVDAGGYGFLLTLEGFKAGLENSIVSEELDSSTNKSKKKLFIQILKNRYEVVALLRKMQYSRSDMITQLSDWGDSLDIIEVNGKMKIHIHTDEPDEVISLIENFGTVIQMDTQDMTKTVGEYAHTALVNESIGVVTDSASDLSDELIKKEDISIVPLKIFIEENTIQSEIDKNKNLYVLMSKSALQKKYLKLKTSQPSPGQFLKEYKKKLHRYQYVICITISSFLSGTYNSALQAKEMLSEEEKKRVFIVDSLSGIGGQGLLVVNTLEYIKRKSSIESILSHLEEQKKRIRVFGTGVDPNWIKAGGRLTGFQANALFMLLALGIRPILGLKKYKIGLVGLRSVFESIPSAVFNEFISRLQKIPHTKNKVTVFISHSNSKKDAYVLRNIIKEKGYTVYAVGEISYAIGAHLGPGVLFCSFMY